MSACNAPFPLLTTRTARRWVVRPTPDAVSSGAFSTWAIAIAEGGIVAHILAADEAVSLEWLAAILRSNSLLEQGHVEAVAVRRNPAFNSVIDHLAVTFSADVGALLPRHMLLKRNLPADWARPAGVREAQFYELVAQLPDHPAVIVPCLDAAFDAETGNSQLLLHDLSDSHVAPLTREQILDPKTSVPERETLEAVIDTLARFHAYWWQHPRLGSGVAQIGSWCSSEAHFVAEIARRRSAWGRPVAP